MNLSISTRYRRKISDRQGAGAPVPCLSVRYLRVSKKPNIIPAAAPIPALCQGL